MDKSIAACSLDAAGAEHQGERYAKLAGSIESLDLQPGRLTAAFAPDVDGVLLDETLTVERACCPFLAIAYDAEARRLTIEAANEHQAVLEALASPLGR
jgi:hypothetical protein